MQVCSQEGKNQQIIGLSTLLWWNVNCQNIILVCRFPYIVVIEARLVMVVISRWGWSPEHLTMLLKLLD